MTRHPAVDLTALDVAYLAWPGTPYDKTKLRALVLRVRLERLVSTLPTSIIAAPPDSTNVRRRLFLTIGAADLTQADRRRRRTVVLRASTAYTEICDLLHGREADDMPPLEQVEAWATAVDDICRELRTP